MLLVAEIDKEQLVVEADMLLLVVGIEKEEQILVDTTCSKLVEVQQEAWLHQESF